MDPLRNEKLKNLDSADMFSRIYRFPEQMEEAMELGRMLELDRDYSPVSGLVFAGMGGSGIAGDIVAALTHDWLRIPVAVTRNYTLPKWVGEDTLIVCCSYSGNTEETLSCLDDAFDRKSMVVGVTSGGKLEERLIQAGADVVRIPSGLPPRASLGYLSVPTLYLLQKIGLFTEDIDGQLSGAVNHLRSWREVFSKDDRENPAHRIAQEIYDTLPVVYGEADGTAAVARRWRTQLEENAKTVAFHYELPEMNHNEIVGYENNPNLLESVSVIWLEDEDDHIRTQKRRGLTREIIGDMPKHQVTVESLGQTKMERFFYLIHLGDWVSFWVAMNHGTDPTPVDKIDRLKSFLSQ